MFYVAHDLKGSEDGSGSGFDCRWLLVDCLDGRIMSAVTVSPPSLSSAHPVPDVSYSALYASHYLCLLYYKLSRCINFISFFNLSHVLLTLCVRTHHNFTTIALSSPNFPPPVITYNRHSTDRIPVKNTTNTTYSCYGPTAPQPSPTFSYTSTHSTTQSSSHTNYPTPPSTSLTPQSSSPPNAHYSLHSIPNQLTKDYSSVTPLIIPTPVKMALSTAKHSDTDASSPMTSTSTNIYNDYIKSS